MKFAELLPKMKTPGEDSGGLVFCSTEEGVKTCLARHPAGKVLFVSDASALAAFRTALPRRAINVVLDTADSLPLFTASDDVAFIAAAGSATTLRSARFFADVRKIPCAVFPSSAALDGAFEREGEVFIQNRRYRVPLAAGSLFCDLKLCRDSLGTAYMRLLLSRLALIENDALRRFGITHEAPSAEESARLALFSLTKETLSAEEIVFKNAVLRESERAGMRKGEGGELAKLIGGEGEERAYLLLSALYSAFFTYGKPRCTVPDYALRARRAKTTYAEQNIPTPKEYAERAVALEIMRSGMAAELNVLMKAETGFAKNYYRLTGRILPRSIDPEPLNILPEKVQGLTAVIRDFSLMEWSGRRANGA